MDKDKTIHEVASYICEKYDILLATFNEITAYGKEYFEQKRFHEHHAQQQNRYRLYGNYVKDVYAKTQSLLQENLYNVAYWKDIKNEFSHLIKEKPHRLNSETFYNSITRKVFFDKSFNADIEYFDYTDYKPMPKMDKEVFDVIDVSHFSPLVIKQIIKHFQFTVKFEDIDRDCQKIFDEVAPSIIHQKSNLFIDRVEILKTVFYRNRGAFIVGRIFYKNWSMPIVIPLLNEENGVFADAVITAPAEISIIFSFTRSSFFAHTKYPAQLIDYLKSMLTHKAVGELYDSIGYYRHGKTILYRDLMNYIHNHDDKFIIAPGIKGMVMAVFTTQYYNFVFKIIRDKFAPPKNCTRDFVIKKYEEVEINDRVGRMAYAHLFENLEFPRNLFTFELIKELQDTCAESVDFIGDKVVIKHVYIERRMTPLNIYLQKANPIDACRVILDYGFCIKELAAANIFPGDLLLKNFGVTRHGRVIFYDYDEIAKVTECRFRRIPVYNDDDDTRGNTEMITAEANDIFPEEFKAFMAPDGPIGEIFLAEHNEIFDPKYWRDIQKQIEAGEYLRFYAYDKFKRFKIS
ncbi:MAG: bifunctional isocitrate dehydrogenase kinase/phosphatase [Chitinophagales bacterium]|jgi:isocitrate dehydrogenase kinase/phosphatase|nr:bifunctional isocitrate dehydrogenase kinase/phosphatase [Saprospirales bacterium]MBP6660409.1 bifunctional isocitrate dehydrogenase kinase/phosphatase [Chitinophagales bacterium]